MAPQAGEFWDCRNAPDAEPFDPGSGCGALDLDPAGSSDGGIDLLDWRWFQILFTGEGRSCCVRGLGRLPSAVHVLTAAANPSLTAFGRVGPTFITAFKSGSIGAFSAFRAAFSAASADLLEPGGNHKLLQSEPLAGIFSDVSRPRSPGDCGLESCRPRSRTFLGLFVGGRRGWYDVRS